MLILHVRGTVYVLWLVLIEVRVTLVEIRKPALHRTLGWWIVGLSAALVPLGLVTSMVDMARSATQRRPTAPNS